MPTDSGEGVDSTFARLMHAYNTLIDELDRIEDLIRNAAEPAHARPRPPPGSRLAVHYGSLRYGKMAQAASLVTGFDGAAIIDVARYEQGLRSITKDSEEAEAAGISGARHVVVFSQQAIEVLGGSGSGTALGVLEQVPIRSKETAEPGFVGKLPLDALVSSSSS